MQDVVINVYNIIVVLIESNRITCVIVHSIVNGFKYSKCF